MPQEKKLKRLQENAEAAKEAADKAEKEYNDLVRELDHIEKLEKALGEN